MSHWADYLTIIPQAHEHDEAVIVGTPEALLELAHWLERAASLDIGEPGDVVRTDLMDPGDGEGYRVYVVPVDAHDSRPPDRPVRPWYYEAPSPRTGWDDWYQTNVVPRVRAAREAAGHE